MLCLGDGPDRRLQEIAHGRKQPVGFGHFAGPVRLRHGPGRAPCAGGAQSTKRNTVPLCSATIRRHKRPPIARSGWRQMEHFGGIVTTAAPGHDVKSVAAPELVGRPHGQPDGESRSSWALTPCAVTVVPGVRDRHLVIGQFTDRAPASGNAARSAAGLAVTRLERRPRPASVSASSCLRMSPRRRP